MPRVSVVMPAFNAERFVAEAVESVLASDFIDLELLLLDDGSTDATVERAERAAGGDPRLHVCRLGHGGVAAARNAALRVARGALVANLDADDVMLPDRLSRQVAYLDAHPECVAVGCRVLMVDTDGRPLRVLIRDFTHEEIDAAHLDGRGGALGNPAAMFRADAARRIGGYRDDLQRTGEDLDFWLRLAEVGRLANLPDVLVRYRVHDRNASIDPSDRERRRAVTIDTVARAYVRRGITDRVPEKQAPRPMSRAERWRDAGLLLHFQGRQGRALPWLLLAAGAKPRCPAARSALATAIRRTDPTRHLLP